MQNESGVTLIEVLISLAIMLIGILAVITMHTTSSKNNKVARDISEALFHASMEIEKIIAHPYDPDYENSFPKPISQLNPSSPGYEISLDQNPNDPMAGTLKYNLTITWTSYGSSRKIELPFIKSEVGMSSNINTDQE